MAQLTKAQLLADLEALRVERQRLIADYESAHAALMHVTQERDEAVDALHRLKDELLASKLPQPITVRPSEQVVSRWTGRDGIERVKVRVGWNKCVIREIHTA